MADKPILPHIAERKPQVGYQSHIIDKINNLAEASPYKSRNEFLDASVQILDDLTKYTLENELKGRFGRYEILLLASIFKNQELEFYPSTRYKSLVVFKVSHALEHGKIDRKWQIDNKSLMLILASLTEFQAYTLLMTIIRTFARSHQVESDLFTAFGPKDFGYLILANSNISVFNAARTAGRDPEEENYILGKKYSIEDAEKLVQFFEARDREAGLFKEDQYKIFERG